MDWIEQWFGLSPDGGDGSIEALILAALVVVTVSLVGVLNRKLRRRLAAMLDTRAQKQAESGGGE